MAIMEHGSPNQRNEIITLLMTDLSTYARQRHASHVVEKVLDQADPRDMFRVAASKYKIALNLAREAIELSRHQFAYYCIRRILEMSRDELMEDLQAGEREPGEHGE